MEASKEFTEEKKMKKIVAVVLALLAVCLCFAGCGSKNDTLIVATNAEFEPFEYLDKDGGYTGFDIDLITAVAEKMGKKVKIDNMEFDGVVAAVSQGTCDVAASGLTINAKRSKEVDFSDAYYEGAAQIIIVPKDDTVFTGTTKEEIDKQLENKKVGVCTGFTGASYAKGDDEWGFSGIKGADVKTYDNISLAIEDMKNGNIEVIIMDDSTAKEAAEANSDAVKVVDVPLTVEKYGIAIKKGDDQLKKDVNKALKDLKADGTYDKLIEKYGLNG